MRVVVLTPIPLWHPATTELAERLKQEGLDIKLADIWTLRTIGENGEILNAIPSIFRGLTLRIIRNLLRKRFINKLLSNDDIVDIHWCDSNYSRYTDILMSSGGKLVTTIFGSDIYRNSAEDKIKQKELFSKAHIIVLGPNMKDDFNRMFPGLESKLRFNQYGSSRLDLIDNMSRGNSLALRKKHNIAEDKIVVTLGYNAKKEQQHSLFIEMLQGVDHKIKQQLHLILPMTYGENENPAYITTVKEKLESLEISYTLYDKWMDDVELAETKLISDITVNIQQTDALSSSIKEALVAQDIVLVGDWLPYKIYEDMGVFIIRSAINELFDSFIEIISSFDAHK